MRFGIPCVILWTATVSACAAPPMEFDVDENHPASSAAVEAPRLQPSATLALETRAGAGHVSEPMADPGGDAHDHHAHGEGDAMVDETATDSMEEAALDPYVCPMHREITSMEASARCEICGMKLVHRDEVEDQ